MKFLLAKLRAVKLRFFLGVFFSLLATMVMVFQPLLTGRALETIYQEETFWKNIWLLLSILAVSLVFTFFGSQLLINTAEKVIDISRKQIAEHLLRLSPSTVFQSNPGQLISSLTSDTVFLRTIVSQSFFQIISSVVIIVGSISIMIYIDLLLTVISIGIIFAPNIFLFMTLPKVSKWTSRSQSHLGDLTEHLERVLSSFVTVKSNNGEAGEKKIIFDKISKVTQASKRVNYWRSFNVSLSTFSVSFAYLAVLVIGASKVSNNEISTALLVSFMLYTSQISSPVMIITQALSSLTSASAAAQRLEGILKLSEESIVDSDKKIQLKSGEPVFECKDVSFYYGGSDDNLVLNNVNIRIPQKGITAIVGSSGSGKSTLLESFVGFVQPQKGDIYIYGQNMRNFSYNEIRAKIAYVNQNVTIFKGSLKTNLTYGLTENLSDSKLQSVLDEVGLNSEDFTLDTNIEYGGISLSGGEQQKIALARAILRSPLVLLLDEITAALDSESELEINELLSRISLKIPIIIIAHRPTSFQNADYCLVFDEGKIVAQGTDESLSQNSELYKTLRNSTAE